jgi:hypothetical protein
MRRCLILFALAMALPACDDDDPAAPGPVPGYPHAFAARACGPTDGPAMAIYLTTTEAGDPPPVPYVQIYLTRSPAELEGRLWGWPGGEGVASASECTATGGACANSPYGVVSLGQFAADSSLELTVDLRRLNGERLVGRTTARWVSRELLCG